MSCYGPLAAWYDGLTDDVPYERFADFYEAEFADRGGEFRLLLDLCCGTGTLTAIMAQRGYDMIGVDASVDMLMQAAQKQQELPTPPLFLLQNAEELDLYGTVDAAYSSLDGLNYLAPQLLPEVFRRLHLFIRPEGLLIFDIRTPDWLRSADGQVFVDEKEDLLCLWRADFDAEKAALVYGMDLFEQAGQVWRRSREEHVEYAHDPQRLLSLLAEAGFGDIRTCPEAPLSESGRLFFSAVRK